MPTLGERAFYGCNSLEDDPAKPLHYRTNVLPDGTLEIVEYNGPSQELVIPSTIEGKQVTRIGESVFNYRSLTSVTLPDGLTEIGKSAFRNCEYLVSVTMPDSITLVEEKAFDLCRNLTSV